MWAETNCSPGEIIDSVDNSFEEANRERFKIDLTNFRMRKHPALPSTFVGLYK